MKREDKCYLFYVLANDGKTDTSIVARSVAEVRQKMKENKWWQENKLHPIKIELVACFD